MSAELPRTVDDLKTVTENIRPAAEGVRFENTSPYRATRHHALLRPRG